MLELVLRIGFSLLVVLGLMWAVARLVRRPLSARRAHGALAVLNRQQINRNAEVAVVRVGDRAIIIGVTEAQVNFLGEADVADFEKPEHEEHVPLEPADLPAVHPAGPGANRLDRTLLETIRDRTSRR
ncbi:FliO/MopB family protein [Paractinoplanes toevensis]|uniref:Flagellar protein n=1 Tax=Paractinoplanes toevensis TaxID=571911 RepID=A0A919TAZ9_9ACTN|nr:flagellar biosynthetic protein FliO [Actinoplanes toevensis]GIM92318.1 hypothetical protein Ato02nite_041110 [Actinoplanes toevensis]